MNAAVEKFGGEWSYLIERKSLDKEKCAAVGRNENQIHKSASMIKVLILAALCAGDIDFSEKIRIDSVPRVEGGGALQEMNGDAELTVESLATLMIVLSDNLATNLLIDRIGMKNIQRRADELGLADTKINRFMMDFGAAEEGRENFLSVSDYNKLLWHIYGRRKEPRFDTAWKILSRQQFRDRIPYYWDEETVFHHKTGSLDGVEHDGGIYEADENNAYSIIIFASNLPSNAVGGRRIGELGKYIFNYISNADAEKS